MQIEYISVDKLKAYGSNPRFNENAVGAVAESIKQFGFKVPIIIDTDYVIVAGHTRLKAAQRLNMDVVPCIIADDLTPEKIRAFRLADNKVAELAEWDFDKLEAELKEIAAFDIDMAAFGFIDDVQGEAEAEKTEALPAVQFATSLTEEHNYIVLYFDNDVDWLQANTLLDIVQVKELSTRKDGNISKNMQRYGVGRIINGAAAINKLRGDKI